MQYLLAFLSSFIFSYGLYRLASQPFANLCQLAVKQLDILLNSRLDEQIQQRQLLGNLKRLFPYLFIVIAMLLFISLLAALPLLVYQWQTTEDIKASLYFYAALLAGGLPVFFLPSAKGSNYSYWSKLLHRLLLPNYQIGKILFSIDRKYFQKNRQEPAEDFVVVTGLARAGTTAMLSLLYRTDRFYAYTYANMPFLMAPNLWAKVYKPKVENLKQRAHADGLLFGYNTPEAFDEYFFKTYLNDAYIGKEQLAIHPISSETYQQYLAYQSLISSEREPKIYLSKNNNFMLRYSAMRKHNKAFKLLLVFREPIAHAQSLLRQHQHFIDLQQSDPFVREYMGWLGHYEFGHDHKRLDLPGKAIVAYHEPSSINYWLQLWIDYYSYALTFIDDEHFYLIDQTDLAEQPSEVLRRFSYASGLPPAAGGHIYQSNKGVKNPAINADVAPGLLEQANNCYERLQAGKVG